MINAMNMIIMIIDQMVIIKWRVSIKHLDLSWASNIYRYYCDSSLSHAGSTSSSVYSSSIYYILY